MKKRIAPLVTALFLHTFAPVASVEHQAFAEKSTIEGTVIVASTEQPMKDVRVTLRRGELRERLTTALGGTGLRSPITDIGGGLATVITDKNGRFAFAGVDAGQYRVIVQRDGYIADKKSEPPMENGIALQIGVQERLTINFRMLRASVITGHIRNEDGPIAGVPVFAYRYQYPNGRKSLVQAASTQSDDRGEYRLFWLWPGDHIVGVMWQSEDVSSTVDIGRLAGEFISNDPKGAVAPAIRLALGGTGIPMVYYPGTVDQDSAVPVRVIAASEARSIDFNLHPVRTAKVRGRITMSLSLENQSRDIHSSDRDDAEVGTLRQIPFSLTHVQVTIARTGSLSAAVAGLSIVTPDENGNFEIRGVAPGTYNLVANATDMNGRDFTGRTRVDVGDADVGNLLILLRPGVQVSGRVALDTVSHRDFAMTRVRVILVAEDTGGGLVTFAVAVPGGGDSFQFESRIGPGGQAVTGMVKEDGSFNIPNVSTMEYRIRVTGLPEGAYIDSASIGGRDALNAPFSVDSHRGALLLRIGFSAGNVLGTVVAPNGVPSPAAKTVLVPDGARRGMSDAYFVGTTDQSGRVTFKNVPPGAYKMFAWEDTPAGAFQDQDYLRRYESHGYPVRVNPNETIEATTTLIRDF